MCQMMQVSRSGYYKWKTREVRDEKEKEEAKLELLIRIACREGRSIYGTRRIKHYLQRQGIALSRRRIGKIMTKAGLICKMKKKRKIGKDNKKLIASPNLLNRAFTVYKKDQV